MLYKATFTQPPHCMRCTAVTGLRPSWQKNLQHQAAVACPYFKYMHNPSNILNKNNLCCFYFFVALWS